MLKGPKKISKRQIIFGSLFIAYIIMVLGVTFISRGSHFQGSMNIHFLSSYQEAWNKFTALSWQFLILNIFMFVPFGFLLPLLHNKFFKFYYTLAASLLFTLFIELFQLKTGIGIFEVDDIFNNVLGAFIGYGIIMALISAFTAKNNKGISVIGFLSPLLITVAVFVGIFVYYDHKELGNIPQDYTYKINLNSAEIVVNTSLNESQDLAPIYKAPTYQKEESAQWVRGFFENMDIDTAGLEINAYNDNAIFWQRGEPTYNVWINYIGGRYSFTDFSSFDDEAEPMNIEEDLLMKAINDFGITIPEEAIFTHEGAGRYQWKVDKLARGDTLIDGTITCTYYSDNTVKDLDNNLITYQKVRDASVKSKKGAFGELTEGKFRYISDGKIDEIIIENISLDYILDTKGFYQPVYHFESIIDGNEHSILIPAIH
ncbi:MAG: VanZ family protein [Eubacteriales bacterium]|nr:VanZ family protein [Eubacteriales bacterium]